MAPNGNHKGMRMWPSLPLANKIADIANVFFIGSLVVGVVSTIILVRMTGVKERYWDADRQASAEKIAVLGKETAEENARASEAQLALEKFKAPRVLTAEQVRKLSSELKAYGQKRIDIFVYPTVTYDTFSFGNQIYVAFLNGGWRAKFFSVIGGAEDMPQGIGVSSGAGLDAEHGLMKRPLLSMELVDILNSAGIDATRWRSFLKSDPAPNLDASSSSAWDPRDVAGVRLLVGPKPSSDPKKGANIIIVK